MAFAKHRFMLPNAHFEPFALIERIIAEVLNDTNAPYLHHMHFGSEFCRLILLAPFDGADIRLMQGHYAVFGFASRMLEKVVLLLVDLFDRFQVLVRSFFPDCL